MHESVMYNMNMNQSVYHTHMTDVRLSKTSRGIKRQAAILSRETSNINRRKMDDTC